MEVLEVDPNELEIDPINERNENVGPHKEENSLEESIRQKGIIQPPIARPHNGDLKVVVGQRRTLAAQSVGLNSIPVIVMEWDDSDALEATITENAEVFQKEVSKSDRAKAIAKLLKINDWSAQDAAENLGIHPRTIQYWLERTREDWESTSVYVDPSEDSSEESSTTVETDSTQSTTTKENVDQIPDRELSAIRNATESTEEREKAVKKVIEQDLNPQEIREAKQRSDRGGVSFTEAVQEIGRDKEKREGQIRAQVRLTFTGEYAEGLQRAAKDYGTSEEEVVRQAIQRYLEDENYL